MKFLINKELLSSAKSAHRKYVADLKAQRELPEKKNREKEKDEKHESSSKLEIELSNHYTDLRVAGDRIKMGN